MIVANEALIIAVVLAVVGASVAGYIIKSAVQTISEPRVQAVTAWATCSDSSCVVSVDLLVAGVGGATITRIEIAGTPIAFNVTENETSYSVSGYEVNLTWDPPLGPGRESIVLQISPCPFDEGMDYPITVQGPSYTTATTIHVLWPP